MARVKSKVGPTQKVLGYAILALLAVILVGLLAQQARFNPAVVVAQRAPLLQGRTQTASSQTQSATAGMLPEVSGFRPQAAAQSYGPDNLSDKINGKADLYLKAGFNEMSCRSFGLDGAGGAHVEVFLYDMGSPANAFAVFSGQRRPGSPDLPLTVNAYATANALFFTRGKFYVEIVADRASEAVQKSLEAYAVALLAKLPGAGEATNAAALFPKDGLARDTVRLCTADSFGCEGLNNIYTGEYTLKSGKATGFIGVKATPEEAGAEAKRYLDFLAANGYRKVQAPEGAGELQILALDNSFEIVFTQGSNLAGVHDASSLEAAVELAGQLQSRLKEVHK
ncbi:MAG: hypothetical protein C4567_02955 [Deltaproteobacteria bacterium]|nr:MAG: hypothetical protein C4567_02955 [Deltaproteobacteria bacterium]